MVMSACRCGPVRDQLWKRSRLNSFFELLLCLLADPPRLDGAVERLVRRIDRQVREIVFRSRVERRSPINQTSSPSRMIIVDLEVLLKLIDPICGHDACSPHFFNGASRIVD